MCLSFLHDEMRKIHSHYSLHCFHNNYFLIQSPLTSSSYFFCPLTSVLHFSLHQNFQSYLSHTFHSALFCVYVFWILTSAVLRMISHQHIHWNCLQNYWLHFCVLRLFVLLLSFFLFTFTILFHPLRNKSFPCINIV